MSMENEKETELGEGRLTVTKQVEIRGNVTIDENGHFHIKNDRTGVFAPSQVVSFVPIKGNGEI